jgi:hypothetical protein
MVSKSSGVSLAEFAQGRSIGVKFERLKPAVSKVAFAESLNTLALFPNFFVALLQDVTGHCDPCLFNGNCSQ